MPFAPKARKTLNHGGGLLIEILEKAIKLNLQGFQDLTVTACEQFNTRAEDQEASNNVVYQTFASFEDFNQVFAPLIPSWAFILSQEGRNDGLVSLVF